MMLKQRINCQVCIKTTSARQNGKISFVKPTICKYFLGIQEPCTTWQKSTMRAKLCGGAGEEAACHALPACKQREAHIQFAAGARRESGHSQGKLVTKLQPWLTRSLPPHICLYPLAHHVSLSWSPSVKSR